MSAPHPMMVAVVGYDGRPLGVAAREAVAAAVLVVGGRRHLAAVQGVGEGERVEVGTGAVRWADAVQQVVDAAGRGEACVVLASGDPGFFGVVRSLRSAGVSVRAWPGTSSVAEAFGRIGHAWEDATVVSAHGRPTAPALAAARTLAKVAVLTGPDAPADGFVEVLRAQGRHVWVAERLGEPDERVRYGDDCRPPYAEPNVVLAIDPAVDPATGQKRWRTGHDPVPDGWALPETAFEHRESMVTKSEVRAVALAHLAPRVGRTLWDVGAGSGSVAIECARFGADVIAVERDLEQCERLRRNGIQHGVRVEVVVGAAPGALLGLRPADAVFVGGGGLEAVESVAILPSPRRVVVALAAVERIGPVMQLLRENGFDVDGVQLQASRLSALPDGSHRLAATNPVTLVRGERP
jgi:precorrin-6Y C5,15-methyltransferase (decarboxylating)